MMDSAFDHLPHGPEFRFIDRVLELDPGKSGAGEYRVRGDEPFLRGHFPGDPIFPGVLLIEAAAQLSGIVAQSDASTAPLSGLKLAGVRGAKITGTGRPSDTILYRASVTGRMGGLIQASATAEVNGRTVLEAVITLSGNE
jgi:3-hydroxyacyl-[acyl-carrier-protein] dehydratase